MKNFLKYIWTTLLVLPVVMSCHDGEGVFARENDKIVCDCTEQSIPQTIISDAVWYADCSQTDWIKVSPEKGIGDGTNYSMFTVNVEYNPGAKRYGEFYLVSGNRRLPVEVIQGECEFAFGNMVIEGYFLQGREVDALIKIPYTCASGQEVVNISFAMTGSTEGIILGDLMYKDFHKGSGEIVIPVAGVPKKSGMMTIEVMIDGKSIGRSEVEIVGDPGLATGGFPVGWNFYSAGVDAPRGSEYDYSWSSDAKNPTDQILPYDKHRVLPTYGNEGAYLTAVSENMVSLANYTFNPGIQINGFLKGDYYLFVLPVKNVDNKTKVSVEASLGAAGSGAGFFVLEYSSDNKNWYMAPGAETMTVFGESGLVHFFVPIENTKDDRKTYNKETDKGYRKYTFELSDIERIVVGDLYFRLRVCMDRRANGSETTNTIGKGKWVDLKGFEVALVEE